MAEGDMEAVLAVGMIDVGRKPVQHSTKLPVQQRRKRSRELQVVHARAGMLARGLACDEKGYWRSAQRIDLEQLRQRSA